MRFLIAAQLPPALARLITAHGHHAEHVTEIARGDATDRDLWNDAVEHDVEHPPRLCGQTGSIHDRYAEPTEIEGRAVGTDGGDGGKPGWRSVLLWGAGFILWVFVSDWVWAALAGSVDWLVSVGGYGLSNTVVGALVAVVCLFGLDHIRRRHLKLETEGDPDPIRSPYDYETPAKASLWLGWTGGVVGWAVGVLMLVSGVYEAFVVGPVVGTVFVVMGRMELAHARSMDARRGGQFPRSPVS